MSYSKFYAAVDTIIRQYEFLLKLINYVKMSKTSTLQVITVSGSQVTKADQMASNGIIHVIDRVMFPIPFGSVVDVVKMDPELSVLLKAVTAAGLGGVLSGRMLTSLSFILTG